ncbi:o-succinylbenzoate--CoA ligase [Pontibacillus marinus]|nr:o-succinylbenzoate--CoA ligase [Pontibacillus marinus]
MMSTEMIPHWLDKRAFLSPHETAIVFDGNTYSFQDIQQKARTLSSQLHAFGVQDGDHVAIYFKNSVEMVYLVHALTYLGAVGVLLNTRLTDKEVSFQVSDAECSHVVHDGDIPNIQDIPSTTKLISFNELSKLEPEPCSFYTELPQDKPYTILYTSGTTGSPKGVVLTYGNHWWSAVSSALNLGLTENDKWLAALPLFHVGGLSILMKSVIYGMPVYLLSSFDKERVHNAIMNEGVTMVSVVSVILNRLLDRLGEERYPEAFRCMLLGGGPAPKPLLEKAKAKEIPVFQTYGMTETSSQIVTLSPGDALKKLGSAGKALFPAQLSIQHEDREAGANEVGEITVKGPMVTEGYFKRPETNEETIKDGWLATGDLGYVDEEGFLYVVDRRKDLIISGGENIYPAEIESMLSGIDGVIEAGVIGKESSEWGEVPVAFIVGDRKADLNQDLVVKYCREKLAKYKVPKEIHFVDHLPRNASNKILRRELVHWLKQRRHME